MLQLTNISRVVDEWVYFEDPLSWNAAKAKCESLGDYQLASPSTTFQSKVLAQFLQDETGLYKQEDTLWIGGSVNGGAGNGPGTNVRLYVVIASLEASSSLRIVWGL